MTTNAFARTVTDDDIDALRSEAGAAGDDATVLMCWLALGDESAERFAELVSVYGRIEQDDARGQCAEMISEARERQEG